MDQFDLFDVGESRRQAPPTGKPRKKAPVAIEPIQGERWEPPKELLGCLQEAIGLAMEGQKAELPSFYTYEVMVEQSRLLGVAAATLRERLLSTCGIHIDPAQAALRATEGHTLLLMDAMGSYLKLIAQDIRTYVASSTAATSRASETPPGTSET